MEGSYSAYDDLPVVGGKRSATGFWNKSNSMDHLGALNNITPAARLGAVAQVKHGLSFQLDWAFHNVGAPAFNRAGLQHKVINYAGITGEMAHDDEVSFNTQCASQWDGFMHYADQKVGLYYNGLKHSEDVASHPDSHGVHYWCKSGIVGRGVLLDFPRWSMATGRNQSPIASYGITVQDLEDMAAYQNVQFAVGDVLIIRTGFLDWYGDASEDQRATAFSQLSFTGVAQGDDTQRWLWNKRFAAVAGDSVSWERFPPPKDGSMLHQWLLPHAGLPIGELWNLEELSDACAKLKKWEFLFCSAPLNIKGGIASPPNAVALL